MKNQHIKPKDLTGKVIDIHSHVGVSLKAYSCLEYPYAQTIEGLYYRQLASDVDVNVVFPFSADLFFDQIALTKGNMIPASQPVSDVPYAVENKMVLYELFRFCPEYRERFISFVSVDPARKVKEQIKVLEELEKEFPIYGIKINPVGCQSKIIKLLNEGQEILDFARQRNIPFLLHTTVDADEEYSHASDAFRVIESNSDLRFCLAHCIGFHKSFLKRADEHPNVWVDTAALKIQVELAHQESPIMASVSERIEGDYSDHKKIMVTLMEQFPETIIWGTDSPAYSYICRRKQAEDVIAEFRLKANYEHEKAALDALPKVLRKKVCNTNSISFLFGKQ